MPDSPTTDLKCFGLKVQPMVHVEKMAEALDFYEALGGRLVFGSRDGDWALVAFEGSMLSLLAHAPATEQWKPSSYNSQAVARWKRSRRSSPQYRRPLLIAVSPTRRLVEC